MGELPEKSVSNIYTNSNLKSATSVTYKLGTKRKPVSNIYTNSNLKSEELIENQYRILTTVTCKRGNLQKTNIEYLQL